MAREGPLQSEFENPLQPTILEMQYEDRSNEEDDGNPTRTMVFIYNILTF